MFTLFHLIRLLAAVGGAIVLGGWGWNQFGIVGCVSAGAVGWVLGGMLGQLPLVLTLKWMSWRFARMTEEELLAELHDDNCCTPNCHLLELNLRGYDITRELPQIHSLLVSSEMPRRMAGWAALASVFPDLAETVTGYNPTAPPDECQEMCRPLLDAIEQAVPAGGRQRGR